MPAAYSLRNTFQTLHVVTEDGFSLPSPTSTLSTCAQVTTHNLRSFSSRSTSSVTDSGRSSSFAVRAPHGLHLSKHYECPTSRPSLAPRTFSTSTYYIVDLHHRPKFSFDDAKVTLRLSFQPRPRLLSRTGNPSTTSCNFALHRHQHPCGTTARQQLPQQVRAAPLVLHLRSCTSPTSSCSSACPTLAQSYYPNKFVQLRLSYKRAVVQPQQVRATLPNTVNYQ